jgi:Flp pilus assembly protein CpaB
MKGSILALVVSVVLFIIAIFAVSSYIDNLKTTQRLSERKDFVLVAKQDIKSGEEFSRENIMEAQRNHSDVESDMMLNTEFNDLISYKRKARFNIAKGDAIRRGSIWEESKAVAEKLQDGRCAVTFSVTMVTGVSWMIRPDSEVDIIGTFEFSGDKQGERRRLSTLVLPKVKVLAVDNSTAVEAVTAADKKVGSSYSTLTVNVSFEEAQALVFARQFGELTCVMRSATDITMAPAGEAIDSENLLKTLKDLHAKRTAKVEGIDKAKAPK